MLALKEFDVVELARLSDVKASTVRTILAREWNRLLEKIGFRESATRGGRLVRYRIKPEQLTALQQEYSDLLAQLRISGEFQSHAGIRMDEASAPLAVLAAEDSLCIGFVEAETFEERSHLVKMAEIACFNNDDNNSGAHPKIKAHFRSLELLIELSKAELKTGDELFPVADQSEQLRKEIVNAAQNLAAVGEAKTAVDLLCRMIFSPVIAPDQSGGFNEALDSGTRSDPFQKYSQVNARSKSILLEVARIQALIDPLEQVSAAIAASRAAGVKFANEYPQVSLRAKLEQLLARIKPRLYHILTNDDIEILATLAAFYAPGVVLSNLESGPGLNVSVFLQQVFELDSLTGRSYTQPAAEPVLNYAQMACVA